MDKFENQVKPYTGWHVFAGFCGFFLIILTANGIMTYFALNSWQGVETENAYVKGLNYNQTYEKASFQKNSDWKIGFDQLPSMKMADRILVKIEYPPDEIPPQSVKVKFVRPAQRGYDFIVDLTRQGNALYGAPVSFPLKGSWKVKLIVSLVNDKEFYLSDRIEVK